jgi:ribosomal protein S18 acetylase RimI-like enzyme
MLSMKMRLAGPDDAAQVAQLHAESWRSAYRGVLSDSFLDNDVVADRLALWNERLETPLAERLVVVAEGDRGLEGLICVLGGDDRQWGSLIDNLHVAPRLKRSGIGTMLMREGARWLQQHHPDSGVYLWVFEANGNARRFYETLGARNAETVNNEVADGRIARSAATSGRHPMIWRVGAPEAA